jgi:thiamine kinase-like enzyme
MFMSKDYHPQKSLFGEIAFDNDFHKIKALHGDINDDNDLNDAKIFKMYTDINDVLIIIGIACNALKSCLSKYNEESKLKRNINNKFYNIFKNGS